MVSTETLQVIINAKDMLSDKIRQVNNTIRQTGTTATMSSNIATSSTNRIGVAYEQLRNKVISVWNSIRSTITSSSLTKSITSSSLAQPFLNAAETIKQRWSSMVETVKSKLKGMTSSANTGSGFNISNAGLATLNGQITTTQTKVTALSRAMNALGGIGFGVGNRIGAAFISAAPRIDALKTKLTGLGSKMSSLVGGLSGIQSAIMGAFGAVGITSITKFTIGAAIARQKVNAVTKSVVGSEQAFRSVNKSINNAISGTTLGYNNMAKAVNNVALRFHVTGEKVGELAGPMAKIGILAQAMGKDTSEAASVMEHAFDGLQGKWRALKQYGITEDELKKQGWSGAADDVEGYSRALDKVLSKNPKFQEFTHTFEYQFESLKMSIQGVGRSIGEIVLPILNAVVGFFLDMHKHAPWLTTAIVAIGIAILGVISVLTALAPIIIMVQEGFIAINMATLWPLILVAAIIVVIAILKHLYDTNETVRQAFDRIANTIRGILVKAWEELQRIIAPLGTTFNHLLQVLGRLGKDLLGLFGITGDTAEKFDWLKLVLDGVGLVLQIIIQHIVTIVEVVISILVPIISLIVNIISNLVSFILSLAEAFSLLMEGDIVGFFTVIGQALYTLIWDTITNIGQMFLEIFNNLNVVFGGVLTLLWQWLWQFIMGLANGAMQAVNGFIQWISTLPGRLWAWLWNAFLRTVEWANQMIAKFRQAALDAINGFIHWISTLPGKLWDWLMQALAKAKQWASEHIEQLKDAAKQSLRRFIEEFKIIDAVKDALDGVKRAIENKVGQLVAAMKQLAWDMWNGFWAQFGLSSNSTDNVIQGAIYDSALIQKGIEQAYSNVRLDGASFDNTILSNKRLVYDINHKNTANVGILSDIKDLLRLVVDQQETTNNKNGELEATLTQEGTITIQHEVNLANVPEGIDEESLIQLIRDLLNSRDVIKELVNNREFQAMDKRVKQKILGEYSRHI